MRVMTGKQERLMEKLLELAGGDVGLVEEALTEADREPGQAPTLDEIVYYIMKRRGHVDFVERERKEALA